MQLSAADQANEQMVNRMIAEGALWSPPLIAAFRATPRHRFLDRVFQYHRKSDRWREVLTRDPGTEELRLVYSDRALITHLSPRRVGEPEMPISSSSQPSLMAQMLEDLRLSAGLRVLEIGAGTGYNAALLAHVAGPDGIVSIDVDRNVLAEAWAHLHRFPDREVELLHRDGRAGHPERAPYDRIMVTAATPDLEPPWIEQLSERGLLLAPLVLAPGLAYIIRGMVTEGTFQGRLTRAAYFMPLRAEGETGAAEVPTLPPGGETRCLPAPWAGWFDRRRPRLNWLGFVQGLAFLGYLRGLNIHYRALPNGQPVFGVSTREAQGQLAAGCWFDPSDWQVNGNAGRELGWALWQNFLDAGGPWPTEFQIEARPQGGLHLTGQRVEFLVQGPLCQQRWALKEPRDRPAWI